MKLSFDEGRVTGDGIERGEERFICWTSNTVQIFWDLNLKSRGNLNVAIALGNINGEQGTLIEVTLSSPAMSMSLRSPTTCSGNYLEPVLMTMGSFLIPEPQQLRLSLQALNLNSDSVGDLYYVQLEGPASEGAKVVNPCPLNCDSTHLTYKESNKYACTMFYNEVIITESFPATYVCACGFSEGYFGIQEVDFEGSKIAIFSLWDVVDQETEEGSGAEDQLAGVVGTGCGVTVERFGNEGTGFKTTYPFQWAVGEKVRFLLVAEPGNSSHVIYTAFIYLEDEQQWKHMASLRKITTCKYLRDCYSFLEDWLGQWGQVAREASYDPWVKKADGPWVQSQKATFTRTGCNANVNAWASNGRFYMRTGGETENCICANEGLKRIVADPFPHVLEGIDEIISKKLYVP